MGEREPWPKGELVNVGGPEMPAKSLRDLRGMIERVTRYRANSPKREAFAAGMAIRETGHAVPAAMADTLDAAEIKAWIRKSDETIARLNRTMRRIGQLPDDTTFPSPFI